MMREVFVRSAYNYDMDKASDEAGVLCPEPTLAKQHFAEEVDINTIVRRFGLSGELPQGVRAPIYGDFTGLPLDFHTAANLIAQANEAFDAMPAEVRARFDNEPGRFVDFVNDPANRPEAEKLGLVMPKEVPAAPVAAPALSPASVLATAPAVAPTAAAAAGAQSPT